MSAVLVIGGSDSSGGAGLVRDVATLTELGTQALCAVTAVTAQTDGAVLSVYPLPPPLVREQIVSALASGRVRAIKIGMLATRDTVLAVADGIAAHVAVPVVLDPVLAASSGGTLLEAAGLAALCQQLLPRATLLTPNIPECAALLGTALARSDTELLQQGRALLALGARAVLLKGGHAATPEATDLLLTGAGAVRRFSAPRSASGRRGTGCTLACAIAAGLAAGLELSAACARAKDHLSNWLRAPATPN